MVASSRSRRRNDLRLQPIVAAEKQYLGLVLLLQSGSNRQGRVNINPRCRRLISVLACFLSILAEHLF